jgi:hypothetical protein
MSEVPPLRNTYSGTPTPTVPPYPRSEIPGVCMLPPNRGLFTHADDELQEVWQAGSEDAVGP